MSNKLDALTLALVAVMTVGNALLLAQRLRRRFAWFFPLPNTLGIVLGSEDPKFKQLNAFADALHTLAHDYNLEVTAVAYNDEERTYQSYNFGAERCNSTDEERARYFVYTAKLLAQDAIDLANMSKEAES
jgi:hypothetical protein